MAISHSYWHVVVRNGNFTLLLTCGQKWQFNMSTDISWSMLLHVWFNFTLLLTCSGQEWQFHIATDMEWSGMAISHCYWQLVVKNGNFTLLLTSHSGQQWQFHILLLTCSGQEMAISHCYWHVVVKEWQFHIATDIWWSRMAISH